MNRFSIIPVSLLFLAAPPPASAQEWCEVVGPDLVQNGSFEDVSDGLPQSWWFSSGPVFSSDDTTSTDGARSVRVVDSDGSRAIFGQSIDLEPGRMYAYEAMIRTESLTGGATLCVEWQDADGNYLGGDYRASDVGGTTGWSLIGTIGTTVPQDAASGSVSCYLTGAQIGTAWWDAVHVRRVWQRPVYSLLTVPNYRGWIFDDGPDHVTVRYTFLWDDVAGGRSGVTLHARLTPAVGDTTLAEETVLDLPERELFLDLTLPVLDPGDYLLKTDLVSSATGETLHQDVEPLERRTGARPSIYVDEHNRLIVDGEPFFPLGMYWSSVNDEQLAIYTEAPFNSMMPYGRLSAASMDLVHGYGIKVIYSIKDFYYGTTWCPDFITSEEDEEGYVRQYVQDYRDHPALLGWYLNDERPLSMLPRLEAHYRWVREEDDNHPAWIVHFQPGDFTALTDSFDAVGSDPYPIRGPSSTPELAARFARLTYEGVAGARAMWMVPQVFAINGTAPSVDQMRSMTWQSITEGAMGLIYYSWFEIWSDADNPFADRWPGIRQVVEEVDAMIPVLLSIEPVSEPTVEGSDAVHWTVRRYLDEVYLFTVNDYVDPAGATVRFAERPESVTLEGGGEVPVAADGSFEVSLDPMGVNIYRIALPAAPGDDDGSEPVPEADPGGDGSIDAVSDTGAESDGETEPGDGGGDSGCGCRLAA